MAVVAGVHLCLRRTLMREGWGGIWDTWELCLTSLLSKPPSLFLEKKNISLTKHCRTSSLSSKDTFSFSKQWLKNRRWGGEGEEEATFNRLTCLAYSGTGSICL